jgi:hypothetical protein
MGFQWVPCTIIQFWEYHGTPSPNGHLHVFNVFDLAEASVGGATSGVTFFEDKDQIRSQTGASHKDKLNLG